MVGISSFDDRTRYRESTGIKVSESKIIVWMVSRRGMTYEDNSCRWGNEEDSFVLFLENFTNVIFRNDHVL